MNGRISRTPLLTRARAERKFMMAPVTDWTVYKRVCNQDVSQMIDVQPSSSESGEAEEAPNPTNLSLVFIEVQ